MRWTSAHSARPHSRCSRRRYWPVISPPVEPAKLIRWWRCGVNEAKSQFQRKEDHMTRRTGFFVVCLLALAVVGLTSLAASRAFTDSAARAAQNDPTLQALLSEVHELRVALQRSNLNTYHAQITIERMKLQQQRVDRLQAQLDEARNRLAGTRKLLSGDSAALKGAEMGLAQETTTAGRAERERSIQRFKAELEGLTQ